MIRVLHYGLSPNRGGIENYIYKIWSNIDKGEFHFDFADEWSGRAYYRKELEEDGCSFYDITQRRISLRKNRCDWMRAIGESKADIVHCHLNTMSYDTPIRCAMKSGVKIIVHSRNSGGKSSLFTQSMHRINRAKYSGYDFGRLAVSRKAGEWLYGNGKSFTVINNGIDTAKYRYSDEKREKLRKELGIGNDTFLIGNVAAFLDAKNHGFLIDIFNRILKINRNSMLVLSGEGPLRLQIEQKIQSLGIGDNVILTGNRPDIPDLLCALDVFVMPSKYEGFPNAVLEAQTSGLRCFISDVITDEVDAGFCEYLPLQEDAMFWAEKIIEYYDLCKYGTAGRVEAFKIVDDAGFSVRDEIKKLEQIYRDTVKG